ncbi:hypothetical protein HanIR_Chr04g0152391 [Helianthus annuus]|nr:hypothetical protein HanIR_Chr04g0152391 [Helianthus annuus]
MLQFCVGDPSDVEEEFGAFPLPNTFDVSESKRLLASSSSSSSNLSISTSAIASSCLRFL